MLSSLTRVPHCLEPSAHLPRANATCLALTQGVPDSSNLRQHVAQAGTRKMGIISNLFGGSSTAAAQPKTTGPAAASSSKPNVWRSVFDPGSNPNIDRQGSNYYDTVKDPKASPSTWEMILKAEDFRRRSFGDLDKDKDGFVDAAVRTSLAAAARHGSAVHIAQASGCSRCILFCVLSSVPGSRAIVQGTCNSAGRGKCKRSMLRVSCGRACRGVGRAESSCLLAVPSGDAVCHIAGG
ncbi:hypothetical protein COO60DRAFT_1482567 [Scenedesmus sp. NREL 46B-D3]|nr:hypothetical protein COO60DRAFT_1482567 [Scenedesmus sp. NREL 46B-D3]